MQFLIDKAGRIYICYLCLFTCPYSMPLMADKIGCVQNIWIEMIGFGHAYLCTQTFLIKYNVTEKLCKVEGMLVHIKTIIAVIRG